MVGILESILHKKGEVGLLTEHIEDTSQDGIMGTQNGELEKKPPTISGSRYVSLDHKRQALFGQSKIHTSPTSHGVIETYTRNKTGRGLIKLI